MSTFDACRACKQPEGTGGVTDTLCSANLLTPGRKNEISVQSTPRESPLFVKPGHPAA